jgi:hypothetical protein
MPITNQPPLSLDDVPDFVDELFDMRHSDEEKFAKFLRESILRIPKGIIDPFVVEVEKHSDRLGALVNYVKGFAADRKDAMGKVALVS